MKDDRSVINEFKAVLGERPGSYYVRTFGCQLNVSDGEKIKGTLRRLGFTPVKYPENADIIIINTCAVRESAEDRVFGVIGSMKKLKEENPRLVIGIAGCMTAQSNMAERIRRSYPQVDIVIGTNAAADLPYLLLDFFKKRKFTVGLAENDEFPYTPVRESRFKASVPIMYGCNNFCTYCIVPYVRGRERSRPAEDILKEIRSLAGRGYKEIMLLGQNVNSYNGGDGIGFTQLLEKINAVDGDFVVRFMSSHPKDFSHELIETIFRCEKIEKHIHLPVQSGSSDVLRRMNRHYTAEDYLAIIDEIRRHDPDLSISTDIIVGFPNETDEEFQATMELVKRVRFSNIYSFIYSKRSGTKAAEMEDPVPKEVKSIRMGELLLTQGEISQEFHSKFIGKELRVLAEEISKKHKGYLTGRSPENVIVEFMGDKQLIGQFVRVKITDAMNWAVRGEII